MKRVIKEYKSTPHEILALINEQYPYGYDDSHLVNFMNAKGEYFHALEVKTDEIVYLIKLDRHLDQHINDFLNDDVASDEENFDELELNESLEDEESV